MMMVRISRSSSSLFAAALFLMACGPDTMVTPEHKCQLVVVVDKTNSVSYIQKRDHIQQELASKFTQTYACATKDIQCSLLIINGNTSVFPIPFRLDKNRPETEAGSRGGEQALHEWNTQKRRWLTDRVKDVMTRIENPCSSNTTDVFSIFNGIGQAKKNNGPWDSVVVVIFSDMVNTCRPVNMVKEIDMTNARAKGRAICSDLIKSGQIEETGNEHLYLTIYTPDEMKNTGAVNQFWTGFFDRWGLRPNQYRFE